MDQGTIGVLNVGAGDTKLSFDPSNEADRQHAARAVADMLKRGYSIMVQVGEKDGKSIYMRVDSFDPETCEYLIMGVPPDEIDVPAEMKRADGPEPPATTAEYAERLAKVKPGRRGPRGTRVKAEGASAVAVPRTAGG